MAEVSQFLLHSLIGRIVLVILFLVVSLFVASLAGWLPALT